MDQADREELEAGLEHILDSPENNGLLELIVARPETAKRHVLDNARLDIDKGLLGDNWKSRGSKSMPDGSADPQMQLTIMNSRVAQLVAQNRSRWSLAGDQLFIDMDLSNENLPAGTRLSIGNAIIEVTPVPHTGCKKFVSRFGLEAMKFVNSDYGKKLNLRGINTKVIKSGSIKTGDKVMKSN
ncbi:MAG: MOSC domain-containing protein [Gammaproteobacteria bacterium]|nr:MOSC domain-containing protein [Gammaproteobacteria bacterium]|tara:strand:- start:438885 stop:439436 length:552 start_codon:yes stop_codon:yes gene_type:complete